MPKRSSRDINETAFEVVQQATGQTSELAKNPAAVALGRLGGLKGGKARAKKLTPEDRVRIAQLAAKTRWAKTKRQTASSISASKSSSGSSSSD